MAPIVLADGPAGLRLSQSYLIKKDRIVPSPLEMAMEKRPIKKAEPMAIMTSYNRVNGVHAANS